MGLKFKDVFGPDMEKRQINSNPENYWAGHLLSPSFGDLTSETVRHINKELKIAIAAITKEVSKIPDKERNWDNLTKKFNNCIFIKQEGDEMRKDDSYIQNSMDWFKAGSGQSMAVLNEVKAWIETLISDSDILASTKIDKEFIAEIVATTGSAIAELEPNNSGRKKYFQKSIIEFGILRYPSYHHPHFKLYYIKLFAWTECRGLVLKNSQSGIKGEFRTQTYVPNEEIIAKIKMETREKVAAEVESYFD